MVFKTGNIVCMLLAFLVLAPSASAWAWPVDGPVLRPFVDGSDPYAGGQHRGIDIGAPTGTDVRSAANGIVSFVGQLPHQGLCLTVRTADGYSVTLVHLGSIAVTNGTLVSEGDVVGTIGPSGDVEGVEPYVYLGIRLTADPNGYLDPLTLLPSRQVPERPPVSQPQPQPQPPAPQPAPPAVRANPPRVVPKHASRGAPAHAARPPVTGGTPTAAPSVRQVSPRRTAIRAPRVPSSTERTARPPQRARPNDRPAVEPAPARSQGHAPPSEPVVITARGSVKPAASARTERVLQRRGSRRRLLLVMSLVGSGLLAAGLVQRKRPQPRPIGSRPLRKMSLSEPLPEDPLPEPSATAHSRRRRLALREWPASSRACRRLRRPVGHHGPVSPAAGRLGPHGQRHGRARNAGHGRRRSRGAVSA